MNQPDIVEDCFILPTSFGQERLWLLDRVGAGRAYHITGALRLDGRLDPDALQAAITALVERHEILRTTFEFGPDGLLVQVVHPAMAVPVHRAELPWEGAADAEPPDALRQAVAGHLGEPFDLAAGPLLRAILVRVAPSGWVLGLAMHHIVSDGWSMGVLLTELFELYRAGCSALTPDLAPLPIQYGDFAAWQRDRLEEADDAMFDYWRERMAGVQPVEPLAAASVARPEATWAAGSVAVTVPDDVFDRVCRLAEAERSTPFMVLLAAYAAVLARWTERDDIVVGTPVAGRDRPELRGLIGFFVNTLPLRIQVGGEQTFRDLLRLTRESCLEAYAHQDVPFERIVQLSGARRSATQVPLIGAMIALQNTPSPQWQVPGLAAARFDLPVPEAQVALSLNLSGEPGGGLAGELIHAVEVWSAADAGRVAEGWQSLLAAAVRNPGAPVGGLPLHGALDPASAQTQTQEPPVASGRLLSRIEHAVLEYSGNVAVTCGSRRLTYAELDAHATDLALRFRRSGAGPERLVAVCLHRSLVQPVALLAALKSGAAYMPIDPGNPRTRVERLIADAAPAVVVTDRAVAESGLLDGYGCSVEGAPAVIVIDIDIDAADELPRDVRRLPEPSAAEAAGDTLMYVVHTSGTTGVPKGAMNTNSAVANRVMWMQRMFPLAPGEAVLHKTPLGFDVSGWEWTWPLAVGARLVVADADGHRDPAYLARLIREQSVTTCHFVPSMLHAFLAEPSAAQCAGVLRRVLCSGEELSPALARRFRAVLPGVELHNLYGPAEAAIDVTWRPVDAADLDRPRIPIGRPLPGVRLRVLDRRGGEVPVGVPGELHIGGIAVGRGYLGRPGLTAERFVPDPTAADGSRLYRTGDRVRALPDGAIDFLGRYDDQVKLRGVRVEPGEIESALAAHPDVGQAVVVIRGETSQDKRMVAYAGCPQRLPSVGELRDFLLKRLPRALVPEAFVVLPSLPVTANGKLDRAALPDPQREERPDAAAPEPPRSAAEELLVRIWREVLDVEQLGVRDGFYELGGNSLRAVRVFQRAQEVGLLLPLQLMFGDHTIEDIAANLGSEPLDTLNDVGRLLA
ncbi:MAG TPA: amino acid adenylation domain-containing protein [Actinocrinis sp.]